MDTTEPSHPAASAYVETPAGLMSSTPNDVPPPWRLALALVRTRCADAFGVGGGTGRPRMPGLLVAGGTIAMCAALALTTQMGGTIWSPETWSREIFGAAAVPVSVFAALAVVPPVCDDLRDDVPVLLQARPLGAAPTALAYVVGSVIASSLLLLFVLLLTALLTLRQDADVAGTVGALARGAVVAVLFPAAVVGWAVTIASWLPRTGVVFLQLAVLAGGFSAARAALGDAEAPGPVDLLTPTGQAELVLSYLWGGSASLGAAGAATLLAGALGGAWLVAARYARAGGR